MKLVFILLSIETEKGNNLDTKFDKISKGFSTSGLKETITDSIFGSTLGEYSEYQYFVHQLEWIYMYINSVEKRMQKIYLIMACTSAVDTSEQVLSTLNCSRADV